MRAINCVVRCARTVLALATLAASLGCLAQQFILVSQIIVTPPNPQPGDTFQVYIRTTNVGSAGYVLCPAAEKVITGVAVTGNSILLRLSNVGSPGGFVVPYCDGNTVQIGPLPAGNYSMSANYVLSNGTVVMPPVATAPLVVGASAVGAVGIPIWDNVGMLVTLLLVITFGARALRNR